MKCFLNTLTKKLHSHMCKHYHTYSFVANGMVAVAMAGLTLLGVLNTTITVAALMAWGGLFAILFAVGKWLDQEVEDVDKVTEHEKGGACGISKDTTKHDGK